MQPAKPPDFYKKVPKPSQQNRLGVLLTDFIFPALRFKPIPNAPNGLDIAGLGGILFYFFPQAIDMYRYRCVIPQRIIAPDPLV